MGQGHLTPEFAPERSVKPVPRRLASTTKAERLLGFRATVSLEQGLRELVEWWRGERRASAAATEQEAVAS
jgi:UDP-glucose 4-epimerase